MLVKKNGKPFQPIIFVSFCSTTFHLPISIPCPKPVCFTSMYFTPWDPSVCHRSLACCLLHHGGTIFATLHQLRQGTQDHLRISGAAWGWILVDAITNNSNSWVILNEHRNPGWFYIAFHSPTIRYNSIQFVLKDGKFHIHLMCRGTTRLTI